MLIKFDNIPAIVRRYGVIKGLYVYFQLKYKSAIDLPWIKHKIEIRKGTSDLDTLFQIFVQQEYDAVKASNPKYIIDGGANIGLFTIEMKRSFPDAQMFCIEPDTENYQLLQRNLKVYKNVTAIHAGIWNRDTRLSLQVSPHGKWGVMVKEDAISGNIPGITVDSILKQYNIPYVDILKLDIEASEKFLFSSDCSNWLPRVKMIVIELHDFVEQGCANIFFKTIVETYKDFSYSISGENTVIVNNGFKYPDEE